MFEIKNVLKSTHLSVSISLNTTGYKGFGLVYLNMSEKEDVVSEKLSLLIEWVNQQVERNDPPRLSDILDHAYRVMGFTTLKKSVILRAIRLLPAYHMNAPQALKRKRSRKVRPIVVNELGSLHGDIGFFPITRDYETPITFRSGFLVCKDILSRFTYVSILKKKRDANSMVNAFQDIFHQFKQQNGGLQVSSVAFDQETSVMSKQVQALFRDNHIAFHAFQNTRSKSKMAEGEIRIIRNMVRRLRTNAEQRWWHLLKPAVDALNRQPLRINNKYIREGGSGEFYTPATVTNENLPDFISKVQKAAPAYYFNQFMLNPDLINFKYSVGTFVRQKLIASSSAVIGEKRSDISLGETVFIITKRLAYVSRALTPEPLYIVQNINGRQTEEAFDQDEITETNPPTWFQERERARES
jgi:hypothetical protein